MPSRLRLLLAAVVVMFFVGILPQGAQAGSAGRKWDEKYNDEPYVILLSSQDTTVAADCSSVTRVHMKMRVQNDGGKSMGEIPIRYDKSRQEVKDIEAFTITPDGRKLKYEKIQDLTQSGDSAVYSDERIKEITMPNVVAGSVIDWQATIVSKKPLVKHRFFDTFNFNGYAPVKKAFYRVTVPKGMKLDIRSMNTSLKPEVETSGDTVIYTWVSMNNDKVDREEYMPPSGDVLAIVTVSTIGSWKELSEWAWKRYKRNMKPSPEMRAKVKELTSSKSTTDEKIQAILDYIRKDFRYVSMDIEFHSYEPHPAAEIFSNKYGDCKDQTLLAISMLSEIGVKAWPVLFPSSWYSVDKDMLPMPSYFNHVILYIPLANKGYYADVLIKGYSFKTVPSALSGKEVFVVNDSGGFFARIPYADAAEVTDSTEEQVHINVDGTATVDAIDVFSRSMSTAMREWFRKVSNLRKEKYLAAVETSLTSGGKLLEKKWMNLEKPETLIEAHFRFENPALVQVMGDMMMFGLAQRSRGTIFSSPERKFPIVFTNDSVQKNRVVYTMPDGYKVVNLPGKVDMKQPFASYSREYSVHGNKITATDAFTYHRGRFPAADYTAFQSFLDDVTKKTNNKVVIKKKSS